jgi:hypothetical protein
MVEVLRRAGISHSEHKVVPFSHELIPDLEVDGKVVVFGSDGLTMLAQRRGWVPGAYLNENFDFSAQLAHWGEAMLNCDAKVSSFTDVDYSDAEHLFLRPSADDKCFSGRVVSHAEYLAWRRGVVDLGEDRGDGLTSSTPVMACTPKEIFREYRLWVVDGVVVTSSLYLEGSRVVYRRGADEPVLAFAEGLISSWVPAEAFCLDVAETPEGYRVVEVNNINSAGLYAADVSKLVQAIEELEESGKS